MNYEQEIEDIHKRALNHFPELEGICIGYNELVKLAKKMQGELKQTRSNVDLALETMEALCNRSCFWKSDIKERRWEDDDKGRV